MFKSIATLGPVGYFFGSGSIASLVVLVPVLYFHSIVEPSIMAPALLLFIGIACWLIIRAFLPSAVSSDPSEVVLDEVFGMFLVFLWLPLNAWTVIAGFLLFRFFDITKIAGIRFFERFFTGATGVMADDIVAALYAHLLVRIILL